MKQKLCLISLFIFLLVASTSVFAMTPTCPNNAKFSRGVGNCCYYIDSSASSYQNSIWDAAYNWENTGYGWNPIYMTHVASSYATHMDFYCKTPSTDTILGSNVEGYTAYFYTNGNLVVTKPHAPSNDYFYTEITFNGNNSSSWDYRVAKHEMGHALGLSHNTSVYSIMHSNLAYMQVSRVQQCDHDTINYLYN